MQVLERELVVVGSGFGGAVVACRAAEAGLDVCLLERGRSWGRDQFPRLNGPLGRWLWRPPRWHGLYQLHPGSRLSVLVGAGLGGGSLIYTNVQRRAPERAFGAGWPQGLDRAALEAGYARVEAMLEPAPLPEDGPRARSLRLAAEQLGIGGDYERPRLALRWPAASGQPERLEPNRHGAPQGGCNGCGGCVLGCELQAKNTLDLNYLRRAETLGAELRVQHELLALASDDGGYLLQLRRYLSGSPPELLLLRARRVVLAAGTLGSLRLLLAARRSGGLAGLSPRLGHGLSGNGDLFALGFGLRDVVRASEGPAVTALIDRVGEQGYCLMEGGVPEPVARWLRWPLAALALLQRNRDWPARSAADHLTTYLGMGLDAADGRAELGRGDRLRLRWRHRASRPLFEAMLAGMRDLAAARGGRSFSPSWALGRLLVSVHPLGGSGMGDGADAVTDSHGRVRGHPGLYVADGALLPGPLGVPPSMTIAALGERVSQAVVADAG